MKIFLSTIQDTEYNKFELFFIKQKLSKTRSSSINEKNIHFWKFTTSKNNDKILKEVKKNDWFLFAHAGKYSFAGKVIALKKKFPFNQLSLEGNRETMIFKSISDANIVFFKDITKINRGFLKTNRELGIVPNISSIHKISLMQIDSKNIQEALKKYQGSVEGFLHENNIPKINQTESKKQISIESASIKNIPKKIKTSTIRVIRDTTKTKKLKIYYKNKCQVCKHNVAVNYSEVHHIWPISEGGDDDFDNMIVLCPNHHVMFDLAMIKFDEKNYSNVIVLDEKLIKKIYFLKEHKINPKNIEHNNIRIRKIHGT